MTAAPLYEVFSSVQGEATRVGERHLFVRVAGCDLECRFCDTPASRRVPEACRVHFPGGREEREPNPVPAERLLDAVRRLDAAAGPHHAVSLTGGEPLLFVDYLRPLAETWRAAGLPVLLETGGHRPGDLARMLDAVDCVMADVKIASSSGHETDEETARAFLRLASRRECAVKVVVSQRTNAAEVERCARIVSKAAPAAPLVLQPVSGSRFDPPSGEQLLALQRAAMRYHRAVRIIPQVHRSLHLR
jgi:7-carboxy-7-deazaguanine synthase